MNNRMRLKAHGKINLGLDVLRRREDGYHEVKMVMQTVGLYDSIDLRAVSRPGIRVETNLYYLPNDQNNLVWKAAEMLMRLGLSDAGRILKCYPFQLSGGMNQRVGIAMAMLLNPALLLADEPTSALDAAVQKQTVEELRKLRKQYGTAIVLVTHNMGVISAMADRVLILQDGRIVEYGAVPQVMNHPQSAYTRQLLDAVPKLRRD